MKKTKSSQARLYPKDRFPPKSKDLPATQRMLWLVRTELKEDVQELRSEMKAEFADLRGEMRSEFADVRAEMRAGFQKVDTKFEGLSHKMDQGFHHMSSELARLGVLLEQQDSKNNIVLEALTGQAQRQDRLERRVDEVENMVRSIAKARPKGGGA